MPFNSERIALLELRISEYERIIAAFQQTNETLRAKRDYAHAATAPSYDSQLALNESAIEMMREALATLESQLKLEWTLSALVFSPEEIPDNRVE